MAVAPEAAPGRLAGEESRNVEELFEEHSGWIYGYCLRVLRSPEEAEDALQTTYLNACRSLARGTRPTAGSAWLLRIAHNVCLSRLRSAGRRSKVERIQDVTILEETATAVDSQREELLGLSEALAALPEQQRKALLLREWKGLSYREIAGELGVTQAAVETLIFRARRSLVAALENPRKRSRLRCSVAFDLAGLLAALKGLLAGGAGVKAVATVTVVAATATVVATDPAGVWPDRSPRAVAPAEVERAQDTSLPPTTVGIPAVDNAPRALPHASGPRAGSSKPEVRAAKERPSAPGKANAPGQVGKADKAERPTGGTNGRGRAVGRSSEPSRGGRPPAHAQGKGAEKAEKAEKPEKAKKAKAGR